MTDKIQPSQLAIGSFIAQADQGSTAIVAEKLMLELKGTLTESLFRELTAQLQSAVRDLAQPIIINGDGNFVGDNNQIIVVENADLRQALVTVARQLPRPRQLPADIADFTGREKEKDKVLAHLSDCGGTVAISGIAGMGGIGKTALAVHIAHCLADHYPDAHLYVDLQGTTASPRAPSDVLAAFLRAFGYSDTQIPRGVDKAAVIEARASLYRSTLNGRRVLVVLDNARDAAQIRPLLPGSPTCAVLITSRKRIALPGLQRLDLDKMRTKKARAFLLKLAPRLIDNCDAADRIAALCGYLPLALRIAGSTLAVAADWTPEEYAALLADERTRLAALKREDLSVEAAFILSYSRLGQESPVLQASWRLLGLFPTGSFSMDAAVSVWGVSEIEGKIRLSALLERSLVEHDPETGRYRLHDLMRLFAQARLDSDTPSVERQNATERYVRHYLALAQDAWDTKEILTRHDLLENERGNLLQACDFAVQLQNWNAVLQLGELTAGMLWTRGYWDDYIAISRKATDIARKLSDSEMLLRTLTSWARGEFEIGKFDRAEVLFREAIKCGEATSDFFWQGLALLGLGRVHHIRREYEQGRDYFEQALEIVGSEEFNHGNRKALEARVHNYLGSAYRKLGDFQRAEQEYLEAISLGKELDDDLLLIAPLRNLGKHRFDLERFDEAQALFEECLQICILLRKMDFIAGLKYLLARIALQRGNEGHALSLAEESLALFTKLGMKWQISGPRLCLSTEK